MEYCGRNYCGWQRQKGQPSVQEALEKSISKVANEPVTVITAGRTDTGVHGTGQTIHFDSLANRSNYEWLRGINTFLPEDIAVTWIQPVSELFHARFSAQQRSYRYIILNRRVNPACFNGLVSWYALPLAEDKMAKASQCLLGRHDFSSFRAAGCQSKQPVREVSELVIERQGEWVYLDITADGFLHHMVRNIVGVLVSVGTGKNPVEWCEQVLQLKDRTKGGITSVAEGLYFTAVNYGPDFDLPTPPPKPRFW